MHQTLLNTPSHFVQVHLREVQAHIEGAEVGAWRSPDYPVGLVSADKVPGGSPIIGLGKNPTEYRRLSRSWNPWPRDLSHPDGMS